MINITRSEPMVTKGAKTFVIGILLAATALLLINFLPESNAYQMTLDYNLVP